MPLPSKVLAGIPTLTITSAPCLGGACEQNSGSKE